MTLDWQNIAAVLLVATAAGYLGRQAWRTLAKRRGGCGSCASCPAAAAKTEPTLVQLGSHEKM